MFPAFLIVSRAILNSPWKIESWNVDLQEAERRAIQIVTKPYMDDEAQVHEVAGTDGVPTFTLRFSTKDLT